MPDVTEHLDWGGGRTWISATEDQLKDIARCIDEPSKDPDDGAELVISLVRGEMEVDKGHCTIVKASEMVRRNARTFQPEVNTLASMARALRGKYDPKGVLNPGLMD